MAAFEPSWATAAYWLQYAPTLHVSDAAMLRRGLVPFVQEVPSSALLQKLTTSGFFELDPPEDCGLFDDGGGWGCDVEAIGAAIVALGAAGWPPLYALVFDEVWVVRHRLGYTLRSVADLSVNFDFAAFHVRPSGTGGAHATSAGWAPHRDRDDLSHPRGAAGVGAGFRERDGAPCQATAWVALSDATPATSCLYCVPRQRDAGYAAGDGGRSPLEAAFKSPESFRHVRALAAPAGGVVAFSHRLLHWGSQADEDSAAPRLAFAFGASATDRGPFAGRACSNGMPFLDAPKLLAGAGQGVAPPLAERVALAAGQLLVYSRSVDANADLRRDRDTHWACFANAAAAFEPQYATQCRAEFDLLAGGA